MKQPGPYRRPLLGGPQTSSLGFYELELGESPEVLAVVERLAPAGVLLEQRLAPGGQPLLRLIEARAKIR